MATDVVFSSVLTGTLTTTGQISAGDAIEISKNGKSFILDPVRGMFKNDIAFPQISDVAGLQAALDSGGIAPIPNNYVIANVSGTVTPPTGVPITSLTSHLSSFVGDSGSGGAVGIVPAPASGDNAAHKFLSAGGGWAVIGTVAATANQPALRDVSGRTQFVDPLAAQDAATKNYVDAVAQGLAIKPSARAATTSALPSHTYNNGSSGVGATITLISTGTLTIDGILLAAGDIVLIKNESGSNAPHNGLYTVTDDGTTSGHFVTLTRSIDMDATTEFHGSFCLILQGTTNASTGWVCTTSGVGFVVGTTNVTFIQFSAVTTYTAGSGLTLTGTQFSVGASQIVLSMLANIANSTILGNVSGSSAAPSALTPAQVKTLLAITLTSDVSGTLQAGQFPALSGDVTTTAGSLSTTVVAGAVSLSKMANLAANSLIGNNTGSSATPLALSASQVKALLAVSLTSDVSGTLQAAQFPALTGAITTTAGSLATSIAAGAVALSNIANIGANSILGNNGGSPAAPSALTPSQVKTILGISLTSDVSGTLQAAQFPALTGAITTSAGSLATSIAAGAVSLTNIANIAANTILGNSTGSPAAPAALSASQVKTVLAISLTSDVSGTLQAAQHPALAGDVTSTAGSLTTTISAGAVTLTKMANLAANSIIGNNTGSSATPIALTPSQVKTLLAISLTSDVSGTLQAAQHPALTGDVTSTSGSLATTISAGAITLTKMANLAANSIVGNNTGSGATPLALTGAQVTAMLSVFVGDSGSGGTQGLVLAPPSGSAASGQFLAASGSWANIAIANVTGLAIALTGPIGYISNSSGGSGLTNVSTYLNTAQSTPVTGTGGSPNVTVAVNSTTPLDLATDFLFTKDAANRQGQGMAISFSIASGDVGAQLSVAFDYSTSANYASGDMAVFLYDITNSTLIPLSSSSLNLTNGGSARFQASFFASTSTSYRLIFHVASTNATAYTTHFARIQVSSYVPNLGAAVGPWTQFTPAWTAPTTSPTIGTNTNNLAFYRRVGSNMEIRYFLITTAAGTAGSGTYLFALPSGYTIDTSLVNLSGAPASAGFGGSNLGAGRVSSTVAASTNFSIEHEVYAWDSTHIYLVGQAGTINQGFAFSSGSLGSGFGSTVVYVTFTCSIPISQWNGGGVVQLSDQSAPMFLSNTQGTVNTAGVVGTSYYGADGTAILANTATTVYDITLPRKLLPNETPIVELRSKVDGNWIPTTQIISSGTMDLNPGWVSGVGVFGFGIQKNTAGVLRVWIGASASISSAGAAVTWATFIGLADGFDRWRVRISPNNAVELPAIVRAEYTGSSAATVNNPILYTTKVEDTHSAFSAGTFTCPIAGVYLVNILNTTPSGHSIELVKNGSNFRLMFLAPTAGNATSGSITVRLAVGDTLQVRDITGTNTGATGDWIQFTRLGA